VELGEEFRDEVHLGVDGVVVGHDRYAHLGDGPVVRDHRTLVGAVGVGRQA